MHEKETRSSISKHCWERRVMRGPVGDEPEDRWDKWIEELQ